jgi:trimeric autotransporter adhesin
MQVKYTIGLLGATLLSATSAMANPINQPIPVAPQIGARFTTQGAGTDPVVGVEGFIPLSQVPGKAITYLEGRLQISTDSGALGSNILFGYRSISNSQRHVLGTYLAYDRRNTGDATFNQLGTGFEILGEAWDFRANAYLPFGTQRQAIGDRQTGSLSFRANELNVEQLQAFQEALPGVDFEVGTKLFNLGKGSVRGYLGGYYYGGDASFVGVRSRLVARPTNRITAGLTLQSDSRFDTRLIFSVGIQFPANRAMRSSLSAINISDRLGASPDRQASIFVDRYIKKDLELAINPATGQPWGFQFVNLGVGTGTGTFEAPRGTIIGALPIAKPDSIIYVQAGSNPGIPGFTIPDGVSVISSAVSATIPTQFGMVILPKSETDSLPRISSSVRLGSNTRLFGFNIANSPGTGVQGDNIRNVAIAGNVINDSGAEGIRLTNMTGSIIITDNQVSGTAKTIFPSQSPGILIFGTIGSTTAAITGNTVSNTSGSGIAVGVAGSADMTATIDGNRVAQSGLNGIFVDAEGNGAITSRVINNQVMGSPSSFKAGIAVGSRDNGVTTGTVSGNAVSGFINPDAEGIRIFANGNSQTKATIVNNTVTGNRRGIFVTAGDTTRVQATLENNTVAQNLQEGIFVTGGIEENSLGTGSPQVATIVTNNRATGNNISGVGFGDTVGMSFGPGARVCLRLENNKTGVLTLADTANPLLGEQFNRPPLSLLGGRLAVELPVTLTNFGTNMIAAVSPATNPSWSSTNIPTGTCQLP